MLRVWLVSRRLPRRSRRWNLCDLQPAFRKDAVTDLQCVIANAEMPPTCELVIAKNEFGTRVIAPVFASTW